MSLKQSKNFTHEESGWFSDRAELNSSNMQVAGDALFTASHHLTKIGVSAQGRVCSVESVGSRGVHPALALSMPRLPGRRESTRLL